MPKDSGGHIWILPGCITVRANLAGVAAPQLAKLELLAGEPIFAPSVRPQVKMVLVKISKSLAIHRLVHQNKPMPVIWNDQKHSIGIDAIDQQHKSLFLIVNELFECTGELDAPSRQRKAIDLFKRLFAYAKYHFSTEEGLFKTWNYSQGQGHIYKHQEFTDKVKEWLAEQRANPNYNLALPLDYLVRWILYHIQEEDSKYAQEFAKAGCAIDIHNSSQTATSGQDMLALWDSKHLATGMQDLDQQHLELVHILQQVNDLSRHSLARQRSYLPDVIRKLFYYSQYHFSYEEALMSRVNWPGLVAHQDLHRIFIAGIRKFSLEYNQRHWDGLSEQIIVWLKDWTIHHILEEDKRFKQDLQGAVDTRQ
jgi:hemerythrin